MGTLEEPGSGRARVVVRDLDARDANVVVTHSQSVTVRTAEIVTAGRGAVLPLGITPEDPGVSRIALRVARHADAWHVHFANRNGAMLQLWGQSPEWVRYGVHRECRWPRIGIRVEGSERSREHWVLLEADEFAPGGEADLPPALPHVTKIVRRPLPLTQAQLRAVSITFEEYLVWPPISAPKAWPLETAGRRLDIGASGVRERLRAVQERARELGLTSTFSITEPDYIFHLAAHGYLDKLMPRGNTTDVVCAT